MDTHSARVVACRSGTNKSAQHDTRAVTRGAHRSRDLPTAQHERLAPAARRRRQRSGTGAARVPGAVERSRVGHRRTGVGDHRASRAAQTDRLAEALGRVSTLLYEWTHWRRQYWNGLLRSTNWKPGNLKDWPGHF